MKVKINTPEMFLRLYRAITSIYDLRMQEKNRKRQVNRVAETGNQVAANIKRLRGGMQYKELALALKKHGRPIAELGLRKIEAGERKVDVDDLMAFAVVFGVSPLTLLLPEYGSNNATTHITGYGEMKDGEFVPYDVGENVAWLWARADEPLEIPQEPMPQNDPINKRAIEVFQSKAKPFDIDERTSMIPVVSFVPDDPDEAKKSGDASLVEAFRLSKAQRITSEQ